MSLAPGRRFGPFEVVALLGRGGMGEVFRARDTRLGRDVAIKVLPASFTGDADRIARFEREARVLASLTHPHIAAIYGIEDVGGVRALILELVEGEGLDQRVRGRGLPPAEALALARQLVDALDAAHERGIVHRDLKPANIRVTPDGVAKVLDFGLARPGGDAGDQSHSPTVIGPTASGVILGTAPYMSPEQARGKFVDKRTDIWAFGCVLYEMLCGRRAFSGETTSDTIAAILEREPDWTALPAATPPPVRRLLQRCLEKDPKRRLRDIADARADLDEPARQRDAATRQAGPSRLPWAVAAFAGVVAAIAATAAYRSPGVGAPPLAPAIDRLTFDSGVSDAPSLSADGRLLAYESNRSGRVDRDIWVQQMSGGVPARITDNPADETDPDLSADGSRVVYRSEQDGGGAYLVSALGGPSRLIAPGARDPKLSPDGSAVAYWTGQFRGPLQSTFSQAFVLALSGGTPTQVLSDFEVARNPVWAPDGRSLLVLAAQSKAQNGADSLEWWHVPLDGRPPAPTNLIAQIDDRTTLLDQGSVAPGPWRPAGFYLANRQRLWRAPLSPANGRLTESPVLLVSGAGFIGHVAASESGSVLFSDVTLERGIERASIVTAGVPEPPARLYVDGRSGIGRASQTRDGQIIVFERGRPPAPEIWKKDLRTGGQQLVLAINSPQFTNAVISPDGSRIGYTVPADAAGSLGTGYVVDVSGGVPMKACSECNLWAFLSDSRRVLVNVQGQAIRVIDVASGAAVDLWSDRGAWRVDRPSLSPDDRWLAFRRSSGTVGKVLVVAATPGRQSAAPMEVDEPTTTGRPAGWAPGSRTLYLLLDIDGNRCLWAQRVDEAGRPVGKPTVARHFHELSAGGGLGTSFGNAISPLGFLYETSVVRSSLWRLTPHGAP